MTSFSSRLRLALASLAAVGALGLLGVCAYQLALARVPEYRATLEQLVRARTGFAVEFAGLSLRWGWYGPEAVFRQVELGDPQRSSLRVRASQLVVRVDVWRSMQSGQLQAGRVTLVAADIDVMRLAAAAPGTAPRGRGAAAQAAGPVPGLAATMSAWPHGRIDIDGGTLTVPLAANAPPVQFQVRRAMLRRAAAGWWADADLVLPERLGHSARLNFELRGDPRALAFSSGALRLRARGLELGSWSELITASRPELQVLPTAGEADIAVALNWRGGSVTGASGEVRAEHLVLQASRLERATRAAAVPLGALQGRWTLTHTGAAEWRFSAGELQIGTITADAPRGALALSIAPDRLVQGQLSGAPVVLLAAAAQWLEPALDPSAAGDAGALGGTVRTFDFEWRAGEPPGGRLRYQGTLGELSLGGRELAGLSATFAGTERELRAQAEAPRTHFKLTASLSETARMRRPAFKLHGELTDSDLTALGAAVSAPLVQRLGALGQVHGGEITHAVLDWSGALGEPIAAARSFAGSLTLQDGTLSESGHWPSVRGIDGRIEWRGRTVHVVLARARSGPVQLDSLDAQWRGAGRAPIRVRGQAHGRLEGVLATLASAPELAEYAVAARGLGARGNAGFTFEGTLPATADETQRPRLRVVAQIDAPYVRIATQLPPLSGVHGTLTVVSGQLQPSTLSARWLGGAAALRLSERAERARPAFYVEARGSLDPRRVVELVEPQLSRAQLSGHAPWSAELVFAPASQAGASTWRVHAESSLAGISSHLPAPLAKSASTASPVRIDLDGNARSTLVEFGVGDAVHGIVQLEARPDGSFRPTAATVSCGAAPARPSASVLTIEGHLARLDLPAWLYLWHQLAAVPDALPVRAALGVDALEVAGQSYASGFLRLDPVGRGYELRIDSPRLAGSIRWLEPFGAPAAAEAHFQRLEIPDRADGVDAALLLGALGPQINLSSDQLLWHGQSLGALSAQLHSAADDLRLEPVRISSEAHEVTGAIRCQVATGNSCAAQFELSSRDPAATLRAFGFHTGLSAQQGSLQGRLEWPFEGAGDPDAWLASVHGRVSLAVSDGIARPQPSGAPFPLLAVADLLRGATAPEEAGRESEVHDPIPAVRFARLTADYDLAEGSAVTTNLHLDGDAEILMSGRVGLIARDYDYRARILSGGERLPAALRRFAIAPHVAAAWLALRDLMAVRGDEGSRAELHLGGTWDAPTVEPLHR